MEQAIATTGPRSRSSDDSGAAGAPRRSIGDALRALGAAQKPGAGVPAYTRWVNRRGARLAAAIAYRLGLGPNAVTAASAISAGLGVVVLLAAPVTIPTGIVVAVLLALGYLLDSADGQVARLTGRGSLAGEWLDHVVDAIRTPLVHVSVAIGFAKAGGAPAWLAFVALAYCVIAVGSFMSSILAEQLSGRTHRAEVGQGTRKSLLLLPTDTGVACWSFLLWGFWPAFAVVYSALFLINTVHAAASMWRKYDHLRTLGGTR